ncbi:MAG TPA: nucleoside triphosphate pyrophosphohydrolase [Candidatus Saccharimonadia bacterium]|nr:nucleoside triphosphate pyrophosphohydrolase [Candidatus Saccharimonadia bacterium]
MVYNKLVRDKIPEIIKASDQMAETRLLEEAEYHEELRRKLLEEAAEAATSDDTSELADVLEVVYALADVAGLSRSELEELRAKKATERGAFAKQIYLIEVKEQS